MRFIVKTLLFVLVISAFSCSKFDKLVKSSDYELKYKKALEYFHKGNYTNAQTLLEELIPVFKGTDRAEEVYYYYAYCSYYQTDYGLAAYHFKTFARTFSRSKHAEECSFLNAYCYYKNSPGYSLDQADTKNAIQEMQQFINDYSDSWMVDSCNLVIDGLRAKLEKKTYEICKQYFFIDDWKAAIVECSNFLKDFPDSKSQEEVHFIIIKSYYLLAINSIESKKQERLIKGMETYLKFVDLYPQSIYLKEAEKIYSEFQNLKNDKINN